MNSIVDILSKKIPNDISFSQGKVDSVLQKIKLVSFPSDPAPEPEKALVKMKIPLKKVEEEEEVFSQETGEIVKKKVERMVEADLDDKALVLTSRND